MSITASFLILAIIIIRVFAIHKLPKITFVILWGVVLLRLLIPFSIPLPFDVNTIINKAAEVFMNETDTQNIITNINKFQNLNVLVLPDTDTTPALTNQTLQESITFISFVLAAWIIGIVSFTLFFLIAHLRFRREYMSAFLVENGFVKEWLKQHKTKRFIQIRQSDRINTPMTYGILKPVILFPKSINWQDEEQLRYVLMHDLTHIKRFDILFKWLLTAALSVHWFNPLVWVMYILTNRDIELSCDEKIVLTFGETMKSTYALTLIGLEEKKSGFSPLSTNFAKNAIEERIIAIMKYKKTTITAIVLSVLLVVGMTSAFATLTTSAQVKSESPQPVEDNSMLFEQQTGAGDNSILLILMHLYSIF